MELECIDRIYLNAYVPQLTTEAGVAGFVRGYLGHRFASSKQLAERTEVFVKSIMQYELDYKIDLVRLSKGSAQGRCHAAVAAHFQKEVSARSPLYRRSLGKGACARTVRKVFG